MIEKKLQKLPRFENEPNKAAWTEPSELEAHTMEQSFLRSFDRPAKFSHEVSKSTNLSFVKGTK
jgi:hypothetical protein